MDIITSAISAIVTAPFVIIGWLIIGFIAGDLARRLMGSQDQGCLSDWLLGIIGSFVGGFVGSILGISINIGFGIGSLIIATVGAMIVIGVSHALSGRGAPPQS